MEVARADLPPWVISMVAYDVSGEPGVQTGLPSTSLTMVLPYDDLLDVGWPGGPRTAAPSILAGLHIGPALIHHGRRQHGLKLSLSPLGARLVLGVPAAALRGQILELGEVDPGLRELPDRLTDTAPHRRHALVLGALATAARRREDRVRVRAEVRQALAHLTRGLRVSEVAEEVGLSRRRLQDLIRAEVGLSPKQWARLARFERSHRALVRQATAGASDLAGLAASYGYADQAHLAAEWRGLAGCAPSQWLRREFPNLQAPPQPATAG